MVCTACIYQIIITTPLIPAIIKVNKREIFQHQLVISSLLERFRIPYLPTTACKEHQVCRQKISPPTDWPIKGCTQLSQAAPSSACPLQAPQ